MCDCGATYSYLCDEQHFPNNLGIMLEVTKGMAKWNMCMEFRSACWDAIYLGLYLGQITGGDVRAFLENARELSLEYLRIYNCRKYREHVYKASSAIPYNYDYLKKAEQYEGKEQKEFQKDPLKKALKEAKKMCLKKGVFARDVCQIACAQTSCKEELQQLGAQLWM